MDYRWGGNFAIAGATILGRSLNHANDSKGSNRILAQGNLESSPHSKLVPYDFVEKGESDGYEVAVLKAIDEKLPDYRDLSTLEQVTISWSV